MLANCKCCFNASYNLLLHHMDDLVLTLAIHWLSAIDVFSARCLSREWQAALSPEKHESNLWQQVCQNTHPLTRCLSESPSPVSYRMMPIFMDCVSLYSKTRYSYVPHPELYTYGLDPELVFCAVACTCSTETSEKPMKEEDSHRSTLEMLTHGQVSLYSSQ